MAARLVTAAEVRETAEMCVALLETQGKSIEVMLSEISSEGAGGYFRRTPRACVRPRES